MTDTKIKKQTKEKKIKKHMTNETIMKKQMKTKMK